MFSRIPVFAPGEVQRLSKLKKAQIASEAERLAAGSGLLPQMLTEPLKLSETLDDQEANEHKTV